MAHALLSARDARSRVPTAPEPISATPYAMSAISLAGPLAVDTSFLDGPPENNAGSTAGGPDVGGSPAALPPLGGGGFAPPPGGGAPGGGPSGGGPSGGGGPEAARRAGADRDAAGGRGPGAFGLVDDGVRFACPGGRPATSPWSRAGLPARLSPEDQFFGSRRGRKERCGSRTRWPRPRTQCSAPSANLF